MGSCYFCLYWVFPCCFDVVVVVIAAVQVVVVAAVM